MGNYVGVHVKPSLSESELDAELERVDYLLHEAGELWDDNRNLICGDAAATFVNTLMADDIRILATHFIVDQLGYHGEAI